MTIKTKKERADAEVNQDEENAENTIEKENVNRLLKCLLSADERIEAAEALTNSMYARDIKQSEFDSIKKQYNSELSSMDEEIKAKQRLVHDGYEHRYITCRVERDYKNKTCIVTRLDNGEIVEQRQLRPHELQRKLFTDGERTSEEVDAKEEPVHA